MVGCPSGSVSLDERAYWQQLASAFLKCLVSNSEAVCRDQVEGQEWTLLSPGSTRQELHGTIAPGGVTYASPTRAPEGDFCLSHDDIDWNWNIRPDPAYFPLLQPENYVADGDHPAGGVLENEWEGFYLDPAYQALPGGATPDYHDFTSPSVDMLVGDRAAARGPAVLDRGHSPYRSEIHPPYLLLWGGARGGATTVHARASALLARPADFMPLPSPPDPSEALTERFPLPAPLTCNSQLTPTLSLTSRVEFLEDSPTLSVDHGCDLPTGLSLTALDSSGYDIALASPAGHWVGTNTTAAAASFFSLVAAASGGNLVVTLSPVARPRQALFGESATARWVCP